MFVVCVVYFMIKQIHTHKIYTKERYDDCLGFFLAYASCQQGRALGRAGKDRALTEIKECLHYIILYKVLVVLFVVVVVVAVVNCVHCVRKQKCCFIFVQEAVPYALY